MKFNQKNIGMALIGFSILLLVSLIFIKMDIDKKSEFLCESVHTNPNIEMSQCPVHQSNLSWLMVSAFSLAFLVLGSGIYSISTSGKKELQDFEKVDVSKLDKEEMGVYNTIKKNEGSIYQSDLMKKMEFSKVKMTRVLDKMESKKILERKRRGMTNIIILK